MAAYERALAWARLILQRNSPVPATGDHDATSLLFPMNAVFEAFVAKHVARQFGRALEVKAQVRSQHLVRHRRQDWFRLSPDLLIQHGGSNLTVLDTKWKLIDSTEANGTDKYELSQADFYQLQAYGQSYLGGKGELFLVYPGTDSFDAPLPVFEFPAAGRLRLWVVPFDLLNERLHVPAGAELAVWQQTPH